MKREILKELPLINAVKSYLDDDVALFSMPGHKYARAFYGDEISKILLEGDITEFDGLDNLHKPEGVIKDGQDKLSNLYQSEKSYYLVNGSTSGNLIMIFATFKEGDKVIVERNCHRSIMNAIIMHKLTPVYVKNIIHDDFKAPVGIDEKDLNRVISENDDAKGIILTYPYYYGIGVGVSRIIKMCKENGLLVLVDSAHGAHFGFNDRLPVSAQGMGADIVVMSAHKTLPSFTQTAYMHVNNKDLIDKVEFYKGILLSTSPSYMFMMSLEYSAYFLKANAQEAYKDLFIKIDRLKNNISSLSYVKIISREFFNEFDEVKFDESRLILHLSEGFSGHKLLDFLRENNVQAEMSDERNVILIPSPFNTDEDFKKLEDALLLCDSNNLRAKEQGFYNLEIPTMKILPSDIIDMNKEKIAINYSRGRIVADNIIAYPPGVPLLMMGEQVEEKHIEIMKKYIEDDVTLIGVDDFKITVIVE